MNTTSKALCLLLLPAALLVQAGPSVASTVDIDLSNFGITPNQPGATTNYTAMTGPVACNGGAGTCDTTLRPASVTSLAAGGSASFLAQLGAQFGGFQIVNGGALNGTFDVTRYTAINTGTRAGANFSLDYAAGAGDPALNANSHWIQEVQDNFNITGINGNNNATARGIGQPEDVIDFLAPRGNQIRGNVPYYDVLPTCPAAPARCNPPIPARLQAPFATPPHFEDAARRDEPTAAVPTITWLADLFLVNQTGANQITVYSGVEWGWQATFTPNAVGGVPEPSTWAMMMLGFGVVVLYTRKRRSLTLFS
jgi:hypothetical protein